MKFKLDENFHSRSATLLRQAGHDAETVIQEDLSGASDERIFQVCIQEQRCLLTLDLDFADVVRFPPQKTAGIVLLRLPKHASFALLEKFLNDVLQMLTLEPVVGRLWIVEAGRIRVHDALA
jgi:predicted nuclease of predicted toxin-antitoxin system